VLYLHQWLSDNLTEIKVGFIARSSDYDLPRRLLASLSTGLRKLKNLVFVVLITTIGVNRDDVLASGEDRSINFLPGARKRT
jgi:hypothetical protein